MSGPRVAFVGLVALAVTACGDETQRLDCDDLAPATEAGYSALYALVSTPSGKSCAGCHNSTTPVANYNFEGRGIAYDALSAKPELIYAQLVSASMPQKGEAWSEADLRLFRTWHCNGGFYDDP